MLPFAGFITYKQISITTMQIPAIITSIVLGPLYGMGIGALFGILSLFHAIARETTLLNVLFQNVLVSVLPRMCIGLVSGYLYLLFNKLFKGKLRVISTAVSALFGSLTNTILVLLSLYVIYPSAMVTHFRVNTLAQLRGILLGIVETNGIIEAVMSMVISTLLVMFSFWLKKKCPNRAIAAEE